MQGIMRVKSQCLNLAWRDSESAVYAKTQQLSFRPSPKTHFTTHFPLLNLKCLKERCFYYYYYFLTPFSVFS